MDGNGKDQKVSKYIASGYYIIALVVALGSIAFYQVRSDVERDLRLTQLQVDVANTRQQLAEINEHGTKQADNIRAENQHQTDRIALLEERQTHVIRALADVIKRLDHEVEQIDRLDTPLAKIVIGLQAELKALQVIVNEMLGNARSLDERAHEFARRLNDWELTLRKVDELSTRVNALDERAKYIIDALRRSPASYPDAGPTAAH